MKTVCDLNKCCGCTACVSICPKQAIHIEDTVLALNAVVDESKCVNCGLCHKVCHLCNLVEKQKLQEWYQGWAKDDIRKGSSSGGLAAAVSKAFVENGGVVCSCAFADGKFRFSFVDSVDDLIKFAGSKYVKSTPEGVYVEVKNKLQAGEKVLFVGLPCQVAGLKKFLFNINTANLFTVDLICHGTPSVKLLDSYLQEYGFDINQLKDVKFRDKGKFGLRPDYKFLSHPKILDRYLIAFLQGLNYTENCYECQYASFERVSDLTLGDSWGSELKEEMPKGVSLVLVMNDKGRALLDKANVHLQDVDIENAISVNHQLQRPTIRHQSREVFFKALEQGKTFSDAVKTAMPKECMKPDIKLFLNKIGLLDVILRIKNVGGGYDK